ncbi:MULTISPECIES: LacI family DNA-binding transcriptional regulator [Clavibacter]|uniref:Transcriptional regulator n=1 Tax=Clavibacter tessellarius TaxID=31965 RepID=A0A154V0B0_9MICO|nr:MULTISPECIES: LacI family DNA-binding transcriptional regulator [Clavibacter]KZC94795.1 transcriptional regulator [Clavibacter michiganensis subsp. tessellarius]MDA3805504.1 LacI family DNA-binding transcriptional regulator [Clavibacter sp. CT19]
MPTVPAGRPANLDDVARVAGVSAPTVSRVITGAARVSAEKTERVRKAIQELGYRPNPAARALANGRSRVIAVLSGGTSRYGYAETLRGIEVSARASGYLVSITVVDSVDPEEVGTAVDFALQQAVAGVVVLKFDPQGVAALAAVPSSLPTVAISGEIAAAVPQAVIDEAAGSAALTRHLLELGHRTVHYVRVPPSGKEDGRTTGWRRTLAESGIEEPTIHDATWEPASGRAIGRQLAHEDVTAVLCGNDEIAMGVIRGLADEGRAVPADVSVAGFDDHPIAQLFSPALTTARQDFAALGTRAFGQLESLMAGEPTAPLTTDEAVVVARESTGPAPRRR